VEVVSLDTGESDDGDRVRPSLDDLARRLRDELLAAKRDGRTENEQLEIAKRYPEYVVRRVVSWSNPLPPRCDLSDQGVKTPSCAALLDDFVATILDTKRWPRHICLEVARTSVERWRETVNHWDGDDRLSDDLIVSMERDWPLPVGSLRFPRLTWQTAMAARMRSWDAPRTIREEIRDQSLPLARGIESAFFAVRVQWEGCTLDLIGCAPAPGSTSTLDPLGPMVYALRGEAVPDDALRVLRRAHRWWGEHFEWLTLSGSAQAGRKKGSRKGRRMTRQEIIEWWIEAEAAYADDADGGEPTLGDLGDYMGVSAKTAGARVTESGLQWSRLREAAETFLRERGRGDKDGA
jgi:hypothetical protein